MNNVYTYFLFRYHIEVDKPHLMDSIRAKSFWSSMQMYDPINSDEKKKRLLKMGLKKKKTKYFILTDKKTTRCVVSFLFFYYLYYYYFFFFAIQLFKVIRVFSIKIFLQILSKKEKKNTDKSITNLLLHFCCYFCLFYIYKC